MKTNDKRMRSKWELRTARWSGYKDAVKGVAQQQTNSGYLRGYAEGVRKVEADVEEMMLERHREEFRD